MNELMTVDYSKERPTVSGRELYAALGIDSNYSTWMNRMIEYGFTDGIDFSVCFPNLESDSRGGQNKIDHRITVEMAKELCMLQRTDKGKECRQYFIELEKKWNSPELVMARALQMAQKQIDALSTENAKLIPKGEYYDNLVDRDMLTSFRDTAKLIGIGERAFIFALIDDKYIYRDLKGRLSPYSRKNNGYFAVREFTRCEHAGLQTLVTMKGREHFMRLYAN